MKPTNREQVCADFAAQMPLPDTLEPHLRDALRGVLDNPGQLIRPEIVKQLAEVYGLPEATGTELAVALEYFHTASLLFDDLPCMDDATERRNRPCVHVEFGDATAILSALALVNRAYALVWRAIAAIPALRQPYAIDYIEQNLGLSGLLHGQSLDIHYGSQPHTAAATQQVAQAKTVSLIRLTLALPAILGGATATEVRLLERIALFWGLSYQIMDDLKDILQTSTESGKTPSRDQSFDRPNAALAFGIGPASKRLRRLVNLGDTAVSRLQHLRPALSFLTSIRTRLGVEAIDLPASLATEAACSF